MDRLEPLRLFSRLAERGSFSAAARELKIKQSTASKWVAELERELGATLVERTTRSVRITAEGQRLLARAREALAAFDELRADFAARSAAPRGRVRVSLPVVFGRRFAVPAIADFLKRYPEVSAELVLNDRYVNLVDEGFDLAIRVGVPVDTSARGRKLADSRRVLLASPAYLKAKGQPRSPAELRHHDCLIHGEMGAATLWRFAAAGPRGGAGGASGRSRTRRRGRGEDAPIAVAGRFAANNSEAVLEMARKGLGIALVADWLAGDDLRRGRLVLLLERYAAPPAPIYALTPGGRPPATAVRALVDHLAATIGERLLTPHEPAAS